MNILFTICGRAGSKGIKNKNIRMFSGYPLAYYSLAAIDLYLSRNNDVSADIVFNTDSGELAALAENNPFRSVGVISRSAELGSDTAPKIAVILDCLTKSEKLCDKKYDMVVDLDITSPLRTVADIEAVIKKQSETKCDVAFSVVESRRNPYFNMVKKSGKGYKRVILSDFNTRQEAPDIYDMNASIYAYSPAYLIQQKNVLDGYCEITLMYDTGILDLDRPEDFELMEVVADYMYTARSEFKEIKEHVESRMKTK